MLLLVESVHQKFKILHFLVVFIHFFYSFLQFRRDRSDSIFPEQYISSLAGRAIADANKHPAPNKFRQLTAPKIFEVLRKRRGNGVKMLQLCKRLSCGSETLPLNSNIGSSECFVIDSLPFMRHIYPNGEYTNNEYVF